MKFWPRYSETHKFCDGDLNNFCQMLRKGVYPYEYMGSWQKFSETPLQNKEFYSNLTMENITDADFKHAKRVWEDFGVQNPGEYHDLYIQSNTLLLVDVFDSFHSKRIETYELYPAYFLLAPVVAWEACVKKTEAELELLTDIVMLLFVGKGIKGKMCHAIHFHTKANKIT